MAGGTGFSLKHRGAVLGVVLGVLAMLGQTAVLYLHMPGAWSGMAAHHGMATPSVAVGVADHGQPATHHAQGHVPEEAPPAKPALRTCPICFALHIIGGFAPPQAVVVSVPSLVETVTPAFVVAVAPETSAFVTPPARAPPFTV